MIRAPGKCNSGVFIAGMVALLASTVVNAAPEDDIRARISPLGDICLRGDTCDPNRGAGGVIAGTTQTSLAGGRDPQALYQTFCIACHSTGVNNSPLFGDAAAWEERIAKGMDVLYESTINGFNGGVMPVRGLCMDCTDAELRATVDYLIEGGQ